MCADNKKSEKRLTKIRPLWAGAEEDWRQGIIPLSDRVSASVSDKSNSASENIFAGLELSASERETVRRALDVNDGVKRNADHLSA
ncbi:MAG: hypothetical protein JXR76_20825 [Deltaproteobacteria bacterium]|nr:hypothetical protein [Deltaproteobacteria bacterium]